MSRKKYQEFDTNVRIKVVRDSSAVRRLFVRLAVAVGRQSAPHKENSDVKVVLYLSVTAFSEGKMVMNE
jgi:hypothetical protein